MLDVYMLDAIEFEMLRIPTWNPTSQHLKKVVVQCLYNQKTFVHCNIAKIMLLQQIVLSWSEHITTWFDDARHKWTRRDSIQDSERHTQRCFYHYPRPSQCIPCRKRVFDKNIHCDLGKGLIHIWRNKLVNIISYDVCSSVVCDYQSTSQFVYPCCYTERLVLFTRDVW